MKLKRRHQQLSFRSKSQASPELNQLERLGLFKKSKKLSNRNKSEKKRNKLNKIG